MRTLLGMMLPLQGMLCRSYAAVLPPPSALDTAISDGLPPAQALQQALASQRLQVQTPVPGVADITQPPATMVQSLSSMGGIMSVLSSARHAVSLTAAATPSARTAATAAYFLRESAAARTRSAGVAAVRAAEHQNAQRQRIAALAVVAATSGSEREGSAAAVRRRSKEAPAVEGITPFASRSQHGRSRTPAIVAAEEVSSRLAGAPRGPLQANTGQPHRFLSARGGGIGSSILQTYGGNVAGEGGSERPSQYTRRFQRGSRPGILAVSATAGERQDVMSRAGNRNRAAGPARPRLRHLVIATKRASSEGGSDADRVAAREAPADARGWVLDALDAVSAAAVALLGMRRRSMAVPLASPLSRASHAPTAVSLQSRGSAGGSRTVAVMGGGDAARRRGAYGHVLVQTTAGEAEGEEPRVPGARASRGPGTAASARSMRSALAAVLVQPQEPETAEDEPADTTLPPRASRTSQGSLGFWQRVGGLLVQPSDAEEPGGHAEVYAADSGRQSTGVGSSAVQVRGGRAVRRGVLQVQRSEESAAPVQSWASWLSRPSSALSTGSQYSVRSAATPLVVQRSSPSVVDADEVAAGGNATSGGRASSGSGVRNTKVPRSRPRGLTVGPAEDSASIGGSGGAPGDVSVVPRASRRPDVLPTAWLAPDASTVTPRRFADVLQDMEVPEDDEGGAGAVAALLAARRRDAPMWGDMLD